MKNNLGDENQRRCSAFVDDVAAGFVAALGRAVPAAGYILGRENRTIRELFAGFDAASRIAGPTRKEPSWVAGIAGRLGRWRVGWTGAEPGIHGHEWAYTSERAERESGYRITPFRDAIGLTVVWLREIAGER